LKEQETCVGCLKLLIGGPQYRHGQKGEQILDIFLHVNSCSCEENEFVFFREQRVRIKKYFMEQFILEEKYSQIYF
jgi:hypothetical protein